jgi:hypothetical protein
MSTSFGEGATGTCAKHDRRNVFTPDGGLTGDLFGLTDRGTLKVGGFADINVVALDDLRLPTQTYVHDLPTERTAKGHVTFTLRMLAVHAALRCN